MRFNIVASSTFLAFFNGGMTISISNTVADVAVRVGDGGREPLGVISPATDPGADPRPNVSKVCGAIPSNFRRAEPRFRDAFGVADTLSMLCSRMPNLPLPLLLPLVEVDNRSISCPDATERWSSAIERSRSAVMSKSFPTFRLLFVRPWSLAIGISRSLLLASEAA